MPALRVSRNAGKRVIFLPGFFSNTNPKCSVIVSFFHISRPQCGLKTFDAFSNFSGVVWTRPYI